MAPTNLPDIGVPYDAVHVTGDEDAILDYESNNDDACFMVDWRCDFEDMFEDVNSRFTGPPVVPAEAQEGFLLSVSRKGKTASSTSTDRVEVLQAMDVVLRGEAEEMRVITESLMSDTIVVMVKPVAWWAAMEQQFPKEMANIYVKFADIEPG